MPAGPGAPNPSGLPGFNLATGITAHAGGGAAAATALPSWMNVVTTVGTTADSVALPVGYGGEMVWVINNGANSCTVYGAPVGSSNDTIAAHTSTTQVTTGIAIAAGALNAFLCIQGQFGNTNNVTAAQWKALL